MIEMPDIAMVLSAGKGTRMGDLSERVPKPLVKVLGRSLLERILDHLDNAGIGKTVVNVHHLADQIEVHLQERVQGPEIIISDEREALLGQGGGVEKALPTLGSKPFFAINSDALWVDDAAPVFSKMAKMYDPDKMDILLMLSATDKSIGYDDSGDVFMDNDGRLHWRGEAIKSPYAYAGVQIISAASFTDTPDGLWSLKELYVRAEKAGRLYGCLLDGQWMHVGTQEAMRLAEEKLLSLEEGEGGHHE